MRTAPALTAAIALLAASPAGLAQSFGHGISYQGQLADASGPVNGTRSMTFRLFDAASAGVQVGPTLGELVSLDNGLFTVSLDFTAGETIPGVYDGNERWLEIAVDGAPLSPRQRLAAAPHALVARLFAPPLALNTASPNIMHLITHSNSEQVRGLIVQTTSNAIGAIGIMGEALDETANTENIGVAGVSHSHNGFGVTGTNDSTVGNCTGVYGRVESPYGYGVFGEYVGGFYEPGTDGGAGVYGRSDGGAGSRGVFGHALALSGSVFGVHGRTDSPQGIGVFGEANAASGGIGVLGRAPAGGYAGNFEGEVHVDGHMVVGDQPGLSITSAERFGIHSTTSSWAGMYVSTTGQSGLPFYGYSAGQDVADAYHYFDGANNQWRLWAGSTRLVVSAANGNTGIGTLSPGFLLHVNGSAGKPGGGSWSVASDARLKKDVRTIDGALDRLLHLRGVRFEYIDAEAANELPGERLGLVAQEVEPVFPDWVETGQDGYKRLTVRGFEAVTVEAIRELRTEKDRAIARLERENDELRSRLERLETACAELLASENDSEVRR